MRPTMAPTLFSVVVLGPFGMFAVTFVEGLLAVALAVGAWLSLGPAGLALCWPVMLVWAAARTRGRTR